MRLLLQWEKTQEAIREAETLGKIVQARLEEAAHKASRSNQLKQESDEARRLEVEARNEARWGGVPSLVSSSTPSSSKYRWPLLSVPRCYQTY